MLQEIGHPERLARGDKHFIASENLPMTLKPDSDNEVPFLISDDLLAAEAQGYLSDVRLRIRILHLRPEDNIRLSLNGLAIPESAVMNPVSSTATWLTGRIDAVLTGATLPVENENRLTVVVERGADVDEVSTAGDPRRLNELILRNVEVTVRYRTRTGIEVVG